MCSARGGCETSLERIAVCYTHRRGAVAALEAACVALGPTLANLEGCGDRKKRESEQSSGGELHAESCVGVVAERVVRLKIYGRVMSFYTFPSSFTPDASIPPFLGLSQRTEFESFTDAQPHVP